MNNKLNKQWYRWLSPVYDRGMKNRWFERPRKREFELAQIQPNHRVLVVGIGTGLDIPYLPKKSNIVGIDLTRDMLERARKKTSDHNISLLEMDAENLDFEDRSFDIIIMNLILSIVENPRQVVKEASRVLKPSGSIWLLHKDSAPDDSVVRKGLNKITTAVGLIDVTRSVDELIEGLSLQKNHVEHNLMADIIQLT